MTENNSGYEEEEGEEEDEDFEEDEYFDFIDSEDGINTMEGSGRDDNGFTDATVSVSYMTKEGEEFGQFPGSGGDFLASSASFNIGNHPEEEGQRRIELRRYQGGNRKARNTSSRNGVTQEGQSELNKQPNWTRECFNKNEEQWDGNQTYLHQDSRRGEGFRGRIRGGPGRGHRGGPRRPYRGSFGQCKRDKQEYRDDVFQDGLRHFSCQAGDVRPQLQRGRVNFIGPGHLAKTKFNPLVGPEEIARGGYRGVARRRPRGGPRGGFACGQVGYKGDVYQDCGYSNQGYRGRGTFQTVQRGNVGFCRERDQETGTPQLAQGRRERGQPSHGRGWGRRASRGRGGGPIYVKNMANFCETQGSCDDLHVGHSGEYHLNRCDQGNWERPGRAGNRGRSQGGMRRAQNLSNLAMFQDRRG